MFSTTTLALKLKSAKLWAMLPAVVVNETRKSHRRVRVWICIDNAAHEEDEREQGKGKKASTSASPHHFSC